MAHIDSEDARIQAKKLSIALLTFKGGDFDFRRQIASVADSLIHLVALAEGRSITDVHDGPAPKTQPVEEPTPGIVLVLVVDDEPQSPKEAPERKRSGVIIQPGSSGLYDLNDPRDSESYDNTRRYIAARPGVKKTWRLLKNDHAGYESYSEYHDESGRFVARVRYIEEG